MAVGTVDIEKLAGMSMEQLAELDGERDAGDAEAAAEEPAAEADPLNLEPGSEGVAPGAETAEQGVETASPGQEATQAEQQPNKGSDKELNFAKLRAKTEAQERELQRLKEENERLSEARIYKAQLTQDHSEKVADVERKQAEIASKFQQGDLSWDEYQAQLHQANVEHEVLMRAALKAEISQEMRQQAEQDAAEQAKKNWENSVSGFIGAKPDGIDYAADEAKQADFDTYVKAMAHDQDIAKRFGEDQKAYYNHLLSEAHALVKAKHRIATPAIPSKPGAPAADVQPALPMTSLSDIPGGVPPARSEIEQLEGVSGTALANRFMNDPAAIDRALNSLG